MTEIETGDRWISVEIEMPEGTDEMTLDVLSGELFETGVAGIEVRDLVPPIVVVASFEPGTSGDELRARIEPALAAANVEGAQLTVNSVEPIDWATHWRHHFSPMSFGDLWVVPSWLEPPDGAQHVLRIDPGMAFGTGMHETTSLCLERIVAGPCAKTVLDVGTGTAILAMAALEFGTERAVGTDNDPDALVVAAENAAHNGFNDRLTLSGDDPDVLNERFELVVANILRGPLIELAPKIRSAIAPGGTLLLSGLLSTQVDDVTAAYEAEGLEQIGVVTKGEWARIDMRAPAA